MKNIFCGIEKLSLVDYDSKLSTTLFTGGCNFKCPFCHNSPLIDFEQSYIDFNEIKNYLDNRKKMLDAVVITGGEPTLHKDLPIYIKEIKELGYLVKLDTNGTNPVMLKELIDSKLIDYVAMDIKNSIDNYNITTGINTNTNNILESIKILQNSGINYEFRTTLIKEHHNEENIKKMGELLKNSNHLFLQKFVLRDTCLDQQLHEIDIDTAKKYQSILESYNIKTNLRGY